jgi:hypothetical protein
MRPGNQLQMTGKTLIWTGWPVGNQLLSLEKEVTANDCYLARDQLHVGAYPA